MNRKELIRQLRGAQLDGGNPIQWVHLICDAADMLEADEARSCVGCAGEDAPNGRSLCSACSRSYEDRFVPRTPEVAKEVVPKKKPAATPEKKRKKSSDLPPVSLYVYRQMVFDCGAEMMSENCDYEAIINKLVTLADMPIKGIDCSK